MPTLKPNDERQMHTSMSSHRLQHTTYMRISHDIRNMHILSKEQMGAIRTLSPDEQMEIIVVYNNLMENMIEIVNNM